MKLSTFARSDRRNGLGEEFTPTGREVYIYLRHKTHGFRKIHSRPHWHTYYQPEVFELDEPRYLFPWFTYRAETRMMAELFLEAH